MSKQTETLKSGFTTGACAQAAAKASAQMLVEQSIIDTVDVTLPNGEVHLFSLVNQRIDTNFASCGVVKDAGGDEHDITHGIEIVAEVRLTKESGIDLIGGFGVGKVTAPGLSVKQGCDAINPMPKKMILRDVAAIMGEAQGCVVEISVPRGAEVAKKTQNARLGIVGGISIIGTRGIVKPRSLEAYKASLCVSLNVACARRIEEIYLVSGYLGEKLLTKEYDIDESAIISMGDHVGFMLEQCTRKEIRQVTLVGHVGKLVKVTAGIFNTHYSSGDARMETIAAFARKNNVSQELVKKILDCKLAEATVDLLRENNLMKIFDDIADTVAQKARELTGNKMQVNVALLALSGEVIGKTRGALQCARIIKVK